jgi:hypothetical protein
MKRREESVGADRSGGKCRIERRGGEDGAAEK